MTSNRTISDADRELFRRSVGAVKKIKHAGHTPERATHSVPVHSKKTFTVKTGPGITASRNRGHFPANAELFFKRPGVQDKTVEKLRKGKISIERELDLHGLISTDAETALDRFLDRCRQQHIRCVRIIHGKGRGSREGRPVIKHKLNQWLRQYPQVLAFCPARAADGGSGAVYVLLKITP